MHKWRPHFALATRLWKRMGTAQTAATLLWEIRTRKWQSCHKLVVEKRNIISLTRKKHELVEEAKRYSLDVVGISWIKRRGSHIVELDDEWNLFCFCVEPAKFAQAGVGILASPLLANCVNDWIPPGRRVCMLMLKLLDPPPYAWYRYATQTQVHCTRNSGKKLVMPCGWRLCRGVKVRSPCGKKSQNAILGEFRA